MEEAVLALWKKATPVLAAQAPTLREVRRVIETGHVDYVRGRSLKLGDVKEDWPLLSSSLYDRENGEGLMAKVSTTLTTREDHALIDALAPTTEQAEETKKLVRELFD